MFIYIISVIVYFDVFVGNKLYVKFVFVKSNGNSWFSYLFYHVIYVADTYFMIKN